MKKIGILTFHKADNYGAFLQAFALQEFIKKYYEVELIDYRDEKLLNQYRIIPKSFGNYKLWIKRICKRIIYLNSFLQRRKVFEDTRNKYLTLSNPYLNAKAIPYKDYSSIVVGSDQVWNTDVVKGINEAYFLTNEGLGDCKKISYAASVCALPKDDKIEEFYNAVNKFDSISVREKDICEEMNKRIQNRAKCVLDPTLLIDRDFWKAIVEKEDVNISKKYIVVYNIEKNPVVSKAASDFAKTNNCLILSFLPREKFEEKSILMENISPLQFIRVISESEAVFTSSFHATAFSLIFHKKLFVFPHSETSVRTRNMLEMVGAEKFYLEDFEKYFQLKNDMYFDYEEIERRLGVLREQSKEFLINALCEDNRYE